jgi:hypothetical protein
VPAPYFSPHLDVEHRDCRTCRYSIGRSSLSSSLAG